MSAIAEHENAMSVKEASTRWMTVTPEHAESLLERNKINRRITPAHVKRLCQSMLRGKWRTNGEAIKIDWNGDVLDGQHRLLACVMSGVPFETLLISDLPPDVFQSLDQGKVRSGSDVLAATGAKHTRSIAAAIRAMEAIRKETALLNIRLSNEEIFELYNGEYAGIGDVVARVGSMCKNEIVSSSLGAAMWFLGKRSKYAYKADEFVERLYDGIGLGVDSPILILRNRLINNTRLKTRGIHREVILGFLIKCWNAFVTGRNIKKYQWNEGEEKREMVGLK